MKYITTEILQGKIMAKNFIDSIPVINDLLPVKGNTWVDLGCGDAEHTTLDRLLVGKNFDKIIAIEAHKPAIESRPEYPNVFYLNEDFSVYLYNEPVDLVTAIHVLEHINLEDVNKVLSHYKKLAKHIVIETPNEFEDGSQEVKNSKNPYQEHKCLITEDFMKQLNFKLILSYDKNHIYSNSIYEWKKEYEN